MLLKTIQNGIYLKSAIARLGKGKIYDIKFSPDGNQLFVGTSIGKWTYDIHTRKEVNLNRSLLYFNRTFLDVIAYSPDRTKTANGNFGGGLELLDIKTKRRLLTFNGHTDSIRAIAFSSDGKMLASGSWDASIRLWDTQTGKQIGIITGHPHFVEQMAFSGNGKYAAGSSRLVIHVWNTETGKAVPSSKTHGGLIRELMFSHDNNTLTSVSIGMLLRAAESATNRELFTKEFKGNKKGATSITFSPDQLILAGASIRNRIHIWDIATGRQTRLIKTKHRDAIGELAFSPDQTLLASGSHDNTIRVWDLSSGKEQCILRGHSEEVESLAFSPDGTLLASGSWDGRLCLWDIKTKSQVFQRDGSMGGIIAVLFTLDGKTIISTNQRMQIQLWDVNEKSTKPLRFANGS